MSLIQDHFDYVRGHGPIAQTRAHCQHRRRTNIEHSAAVLLKAREIASTEYADALLNQTIHCKQTAQHDVAAAKRQFEFCWKSAKEAVKAKYGRSVLESALISIDLE